MECELCGRSCDCRPAIVDGVKMMLCPGCMKHGKEVITASDQPVRANRNILERIKRPKEKDIYQGMNKELISDWSRRIKSARGKKGLSREELGFKIGERTVTISKIENGNLKPSDKVAEKLEKELDIMLFEEVKTVANISAESHSKGFTLGDFVKTKEK
ncbi:MAG: multiprotein bridging factor aMBF1 [Candidatus Thermoplasmatota archaeon]|nr:multiprotein bridging factor aMBF1 [Candidatus Thermoplasmatota archaeon]